MEIEKIVSNLLCLPYHCFEERQGGVVFPENTPQDVVYVFSRYKKIGLFIGSDQAGAPYENTVTLEPIFGESVFDTFPEDLGDGFSGYKYSYYLGHFSSGEDQLILDLSNKDPLIRSHAFYPPLPLNENSILSGSLKSFLNEKLKERPIESIYTK